MNVYKILRALWFLYFNGLIFYYMILVMFNWIILIQSYILSLSFNDYNMVSSYLKNDFKYNFGSSVCVFMAWFIFNTGVFLFSPSDFFILIFMSGISFFFLYCLCDNMSKITFQGLK